ncbi:MAG: hypothetical protein DRJ52_11075 [Thermoprotei archaeon]|nr:MAG: hypothetical protein DRJ52_11075 [Thermoprotei archaeon]
MSGDQYYRKVMRKPKLSLRDYFPILLLFFKRSVKAWSMFKVSFAFNVIGMIVGVFSYYFIKLMFSPSEVVSSLEPYGGDFMTFLIVGLAFQQFVDTALHGYYEGLASAYWSCTLEQYLTTPLSPLAFCLAQTMWGIILGLFNILLYLVIGIVVFKIKVVCYNVAYVVLVLLLSVVSVSGLGLLAASTFMLMNAKSWEDPVRWFINTLEGLVVGTYYTPKILPTWLQALGLILPQTYALDALRRLLIRGSKPEDVLLVHSLLLFDPLIIDIIFLIILSILYLPLGYYMFKKGIDFSRKIGNLSRWV